MSSTLRGGVLPQWSNWRYKTILAVDLLAAARALVPHLSVTSPFFCVAKLLRVSLQHVCLSAASSATACSAFLRSITIVAYITAQPTPNTDVGTGGSRRFVRYMHLTDCHRTSVKEVARQPQ